ncbi:MAG: hypothetical protein JW929_02770 [Anaerolineales bacterium]|nr:hypothetical protein [Anaerolineales bacterium]
MQGFVSILGGLLLFGGACALTLFRSWKHVLPAFALQSLGVGLSVLPIVDPPVAIVKVVVGWIAVSLLAVTLAREPRSPLDEKTAPIDLFFRFSLLLFLFSSVLALLPQFAGLFRNPPAGLLFVSCFLIGIGLLNLGLSEHPLRSGVSLLALLQGFELGYLWIEQSLLVLALLAVTDLAIVMTLIFLYTHALSPSSEEVAP